MKSPPVPLIEICNLRRVVAGRERPLLSVDQFTVSSGDRLGLVGPSGGGKSSLLRVLALLDPCEQLTFRFRGRAVAADDTPPFRKQAILLPQQAVISGPTIRDDLQSALALRVHRSRRFQESRAVALLEALGQSAPVA